MPGRRGADPGHLDGGDAQLADEPAKVVGDPGSRPWTFGRDGLGGRPAGLGQRERPASVAVLDRDEALVLELLEGRIDRAGARAPATAAALAELLHDLVAVHRLLGQEGQGRFADRAATRVESAASGRGRGRRRRGRVAGHAAGSSSRPARPRSRREPGVSIEMVNVPRVMPGVHGGCGRSAREPPRIGSKSIRSFR